MITLADDEKAVASAIKQLSDQAGSHSPSIFTIAEELPQLEINIDACFLSNPYATDLVLEDFRKELLHQYRIIYFYTSINICNVTHMNTDVTRIT